MICSGDSLYSTVYSQLSLPGEPRYYGHPDITDSSKIPGKNKL